MLGKLKSYALAIASLVALLLVSALAVWQRVKLGRSNDLANSAIDLAVSENRELKKQAIKDRLNHMRETANSDLNSVQKTSMEGAKNADGTLADVVNGLRADTSSKP